MKQNTVVRKQEKRPKRGYGLDKYYEEERIENERKQAKNKKKKIKKRIFLCIKILIALIILGVIGIFLFFKTRIAY